MSDVHWKSYASSPSTRRDASGAVGGGVWDAGMPCTVPMSITAVHCVPAIQYSASQCHLSQLQGSSL